MISYEDVVKDYGSLRAVNHLNLEVEKGEIFGLLGPNGAGKTTLMRMTTALTAPTSGRIAIQGEAVKRESPGLRSRMGIVPQSSTLEDDLTAWENLEFHGLLYGMKKGDRRKRAGELLDFVELTDRKNEPVRNFSGGMRRKLMIAQALMHGPEILLMDEPTVGLDAGVRRRIWDLIRTLHRQGLTVFLTTHYLEEAQVLCTRVGMICEGTLVTTGTPREMIRDNGSYVLEYDSEGRTVQEFFKDREEAWERGKTLPSGFQVREANLEDVFIRLTSRRLYEREGEA